MTREDAINTLIRTGGVETNKISDGYHTFGELYEHRCRLFIGMCAAIQRYSDERNEIFLVWKSQKHSDGTSIDDWFIMGIFRKEGMQMTYHLPMTMWDDCVFAETLDKAPQWDNHTPEDVLRRIQKYIVNREF